MYWRGDYVGQRPTLREARRLVSRFPFKRGNALIRHSVTGEEWKRINREWFKVGGETISVAGGERN